MKYKDYEIREEICPHCGRTFQSPHRQLVTTPEDVYISIPIYCPFCQFKAYRVFHYAETDFCFTDTDYIPCLAGEVGSSIDTLLTMFEEYKEDCTALNKEEPLNLLELLEKQKEEYKVKKGYRLV